MSEANFLAAVSRPGGIPAAAGRGARRAWSLASRAAIEDRAPAISARTSSSTAERLAEFHRVENTYISTFQTLGGLGLLVGTIGLAAVLLRNVLERRRELALLGAVGYRRAHVFAIVLAENVLLLVWGLADRHGVCASWPSCPRCSTAAGGCRSAPADGRCSVASSWPVWYRRSSRRARRCARRCSSALRAE